MRGGDTTSCLGGDGLTARVFRALYPQFDLRTVESTTHVVVPKGIRGSQAPAWVRSRARSGDHEKRQAKRAE